MLQPGARPATVAGLLHFWRPTPASESHVHTKRKTNEAFKQARPYHPFPRFSQKSCLIENSATPTARRRSPR